MKRVSAKLKLTLWTALLMVLMAGALMALMFYLSDNIISSNSKSILTKVVGDNADELEFDDGRIDTDDIDFFKNSVYTLLYSEDGEKIAGSFPEEFSTEPPLSDKKLTEITQDGTLYYIYDILSPVEDSRNPAWVRGVIAVDEVASAINSIMQIALISLPIIVVLGTVGCYFIAKKTFSPIDKIIKTAEEISESENLSLRIDLKGESAELQKLADTFDIMFSRLENAFEVEKQFTSDVSHELRTPTSVILAQCEYAIGHSIPMEDKEDALETVQRQASKISKLISDLLNLTRLDSGIEKADFREINLSELVNEICEEHKIISPSGIELTHSIAPDIKGAFDAAMMSRLLGNLISNAFRYSKETGKVEVSLTESQNDIVLSVKDDGIGISKQDQQKIFQRFYQVDSSRTMSQSGNMGLGLAMVEQIAKLHNAKITVESEIGVGSVFRIKFKKN